MDLTRSLADSSEEISKEQLERMLSEHTLFLENGGRGGRFQRLGLSGLSLCVYSHKSTKGTQFSIARKKLPPGTDLSRVDLSHADLSSCICERVNFKGAKLEGAILTDSFFKGANFEKASLKNVDLSDSDLTETNFTDARFLDTDFERATITGAQFGDTSNTINLEV